MSRIDFEEFRISRALQERLLKEGRPTSSFTWSAALRHTSNGTRWEGVLAVIGLVFAVVALVYIALWYL
jgi:hypothetical protein